MKKVLLWLLMVVLTVFVMVGGAIGVSYWSAGTGSLPEETAAFGGKTLESVGYDWQVPVLGGVVNRRVYSAATLSAQKLGAFGDVRPELQLPSWCNQAQVTLTDASGSVVLRGSAEDYAGYVYEKNGSYTIEVRLSKVGESKPAKPTGYTLCRAVYTVNFEPKATLSSSSVQQGSIVALWITGVLEQAQPKAETDLGEVWFRQTKGGWMGYLPVTYNAEAGKHDIHVTCGVQTMTVQLSVTKYEAEKADYVDDGSNTNAAAQEYRNAIWPTYTVGTAIKQWSGRFRHPAEAVLVAYGSPLMENEQRVGVATGITYWSDENTEVKAPQDGTVLFAGTLAMTGGTVVIDHGCGVKSYLYGLGRVDVTTGEAVTIGQVLGVAGTEHQLIYEMRIGSKTVNPLAAINGSSGLQYREDV